MGTSFYLTTVTGNVLSVSITYKNTSQLRRGMNGFVRYDVCVCASCRTFCNYRSRNL